MNRAFGIVALALFLLLSCAFLVQAQEESKRITIFYTGNTRGYLNPCPS